MGHMGVRASTHLHLSLRLVLGLHTLHGRPTIYSSKRTIGRRRPGGVHERPVRGVDAGRLSSIDGRRRPCTNRAIRIYPGPTRTPGGGRIKPLRRRGLSFQPVVLLWLRHKTPDRRAHNPLLAG